MDYRDYIAEMDALIDVWAKPANCVPGIAAAKIVETADPVLLEGWLRAMAADFLATVIARRKRSAASDDRSRSGARAFGKAREEASRGDLSALGSFALSYTVDAKDTRRKVADMTGTDHEFVAASCEKDAKAIALLAEFHRQVARKVGGKRTGDVLSEKQYDHLYRSIVRPRTLEAVV